MSYDQFLLMTHHRNREVHVLCVISEVAKVESREHLADRFLANAQTVEVQTDNRGTQASAHIHRFHSSGHSESQKLDNFGRTEAVDQRQKTELDIYC